MQMALAILQRLKDQDRAKRTRNPGRRVSGQKMTPELARQILELHGTTGKTQQEIAFAVGVNQGRVNEVIKRGKWLSGDPQAPEALARDEALERAAKGIGKSPRPERERKPAVRKKKAEKAAIEVQAVPVEVAPVENAAAPDAKPAKAARKFKP